MKASLVAAMLALAPAFLLAQNVGSPIFNGPAVLTNGIGTVGQRAGQDVDLRYFGSVSGVYDSGISPFSLDSDGKLLKPEPAYGVEVGFGGYGRHYFRHSFIGLDYTGNYRHYANSPNYDGTNQQLSLEYAIQASRRWIFDVRADAGTQIYGTAFGPAYPGSGVPDSNLLLFDNRTTYLQGGVNATYLLSGRTSVTMGGSGSTVHREAVGLAGSNGYMFNGSIQHQVSRDLFVTGSYQYSHYEFTRVVGSSTSNNYMASLTKRFGRTWSLTVGGGAFTSSVVSVQYITLDPVLAEILGVPVIPVIGNRDNLFPTGQISLSKQFRRSNITASANRVIIPGNGLYLTSRQDSIAGGYSYSGFRHFSLSVTGGWGRMSSLAQSISAYGQFNGGANLSYNLGHGINLNASYYRRHQDIVSGNYLTNSSRVSFGIFFTPSNIPISFH